jgi:hypothetical protein
MNRNRIGNSQTGSTAIESILATEEELLPSSGFLSAVMERVHDEAYATAPIPFPWRRAVPGIVLTAGVFAWATYEFVRQGVAAAGSITFNSPQIPAAIERPLEQAGWVAMALAVSLVSWLLSRRIAGQSGL